MNLTCKIYNLEMQFERLMVQMIDALEEQKWVELTISLDSLKVYHLSGINIPLNFNGTHIKRKKNTQFH